MTRNGLTSAGTRGDAGSVQNTAKGREELSAFDLVAGWADDPPVELAAYVSAISISRPSPGSRSAILDVEGPGGDMRIVVWTDGQAQVNVFDAARQEVTTDDYVLLLDEAGLLRALRSALAVVAGSSN